MSGQYLRLYQEGTEPSDAYLLAGGGALFFLTDVDKYSIQGQNIIIGGTEVLLDKVLGLRTFRLETALAESSAQIKRIPAEKFIAGLSQVSFLINVAMVLAKQVVLTNQIISRYEHSLHGKERDRQKVCLEYYKIVRDVKEVNTKRMLPWLKEFITKYETSLIYREGEALSRTAEPVRITSVTHLTDKMAEYPKDSLLCEEGTDGAELFILQSGTIDVLVKGNPVATISEQGTPIGEIALLIGEKRSATLKARNNVVVTRIRKNEIKEVAEREIGVVQSIAHSLGKKHFQNVHRVRDLTGKSIEKEIADNSGQAKSAMKFTNAQTELSSVRNAFSELVFRKNESFLKEIAVRYAID
jgi:CRP-like cAMP-binding protein